MASSRTNLGPLTTTFVYPTGCRNIVQDCPSCTLAWQGQECGTNSFNEKGLEDGPDCWPPRKADTPFSTGVALNGWGFYSPGLACPVGYATACAATQGVAGGQNFQFPLEASETGIGCCPIGYSCKFAPGIDLFQTCYSVAGAGAALSTVSCSAQQTLNSGTLRLPASVRVTADDGSVAVSTVSAVTVFAPMFQLVRQASDLAANTPTATGTGAGANKTLPPATGAPPAGSGGGGLSAGATAGIAVACVLIGLAVIGGGIFFCMRRRKAARSVGHELGADQTSPNYNNYAPKYGAYTNSTEHAAPAAPQFVHEASAEQKMRAELA